ncbi:Cad1p [Maudiozyma barnettii]|uniref:Similar to Saccharomyces cerevisiae YDR423C CAD1 AP-1-like basic leucine zipper (BZIP) transcriptional activator involved in stress responsesiron metabolism, and pleiotropic drug resistance n=1 Tax=Maudiozyma barnettii TaxID=61262 RepID=A0A8H2ZIY0_9SACH|nr:Cad1p [Kazachstania barnettii]CAB4253702.1 similar to Saccharomyces cerevisiae YDR423C CAD1 AP-1-like basic leucine zipper (bZIP) transcriptional activator involved in stress responsesiron metabolism, and pleiotropic drug resistance [Kazachstania barnettii]
MAATTKNMNTDTISNDASVQKPKRKVGRPGRKKIDTEAKNRRTAQNRAAQRAFRERKEQKLKSLESKISNLEKINEHSEYESELLKNHLNDLINEITKFRPKSQKDLQVLDLLTRNNIVKEELRIQNIQEDENIANLDNPKGIQSTDASTTTLSSPHGVQQTEVLPVNLKRDEPIGIKPEPIYTPDTSNSPMSINSNNGNNNQGITEQSLFAAAAAEDIAAAMGNNNYMNTTGVSNNNNISGACSGGCNSNSNSNNSNSNSNSNSCNGGSSSGSSSAGSNMDIIDDLFNAAYSFDTSYQFGNNNNDISLSASTKSHSDINSEYNMTNRFPDISNNTNIFSMYGNIGNNNAATTATTATPIDNNKSSAFGQTIPQFTLNNLSNTWNNNFTASVSDRIPSTQSSVVDGNDLAAIQYAFDVPPQMKTTVSDANNNNNNNNNKTSTSTNDGNGPQFMSFLNTSLAFPDMEDNVLFREHIPDNASCSEPTPDCACHHNEDENEHEHEHPVFNNGKPIKCELLTRHIINDESIHSILRDKNFMATGDSTVASACAADCDGKSCNKVVLPYDNAGNTMKCADLWRHITTLPKYSAVDIDNLCDELMTKINYSDEGITIKSRDFDTALRKQILS